MGDGRGGYLTAEGKEQTSLYLEHERAHVIRHTSHLVSSSSGMPSFSFPTSLLTVLFSHNYINDSSLLVDCVNFPSYISFSSNYSGYFGMSSYITQLRNSNMK